jgi:hypothetical protein
MILSLNGVVSSRNVDENYSPDKALFYYSRDEFAYRLLNRVLRRQSIEGILSFRFLLHDIREQLRREYQHFSTMIETSQGTFYRGQQMSWTELEELKKKRRTGTLITTNTYFSTSRNRQTAIPFAGRSSDEMVAVLFVITALIERNEQTPFAYIGYQGAFGHAEDELLFSVNSFFQITNISHEPSERLWIVEIDFIDEDHQCSSEITEDSRRLQASPLELMLITIGNLLADHPGQGPSAAEAFYQLISNQHFSELLTTACQVGSV